MSKEEFEKYIESIEFKKSNWYYVNKKCVMYLYTDHYNFYSGYKWFKHIDYNDLTPLKQIERSYKLKKILG